MPKAVIDASALLAVLYGEPGADVTLGAMGDAVMSAVNVAEAISKLVVRGIAEHDAIAAVHSFDVEVAPVDERQAALAGLLHARSRRQGVSLGDAFCLALAKAVAAPALTADRRWASLDLGVAVTLIR
ncbi:MAG TPA: PIN domain-containing protein [Caulobacteraceae bacterium]